MKEIISKLNKGIGIIRKLRSILPRNASLTIYKSFIRQNIDYCDFIFDQAHNESFCNLERLQYNINLTITSAIKGTSKLKIYEELGLESLKFRRWMHHLCVFYKIKTKGHLEYLYKLILAKSSFYNTHNSDHIKTYYCRTSIFKYCIHSFLIQLMNGTDWTAPFVIQNPRRNPLLKIARTMPKPTFNIHNPYGLKLSTYLRLGLKLITVLILRIASILYVCVV